MEIINTPLNQFARLFIGSIKLFFRGLKYFIPVAAVFCLPLFFIEIAIADRVIDFMVEYINTGVFNEEQADVVFISVAKDIVFLPLLIAAVAHVSDLLLKNDKPTAASIMEKVVTKFPRLVLASIFFAIVFFIGLSLFVLPGIYFAVNHYFFVSLIVFTNASGIRVLIESRRLMRGFWFRTVFFIIAMAVFDFSVNTVIATVLELTVGSSYYAVWIAAFLSYFIKVICYIFFTLYYFDVSAYKIKIAIDAEENNKPL